MNSVTLIGRMTKDIELKDAGGTKVANFSLAVDREIKSEGKPDVDFIECASFGKTAEFMEKYTLKGSKIAVQGRIQVDSYTDKEGKKRNRNTVVVNHMEFAGSKPSNAGTDDGDEVPFA